MAKKKINRQEPLPLRGSSLIKEDDSRIIFSQAIKPWMICSWIQNDFGIDAICEITKPLSTSKNQIVTGKRFSVQLKSSDTSDFNRDAISLSARREKINYWFNSIEPVLLVYIDLKSGNCFFRWIDETLVKELYKINSNWIAHETVSIKFQKESIISTTSIPLLEKYVLQWKRPAKSILTPGNYFKFSQEAKTFIDRLISKINSHHINFLQEEINSLETSLSQTIYTVAVVGPTKAGKSTLINCLLHKSVSPVGMLPTTGIPITIFPSNQNEAIVLFKDNKELSASLDENFIEEYTSKKKNPGNKKNVKLVSVNIVNTLLEKGFAICDVPGLDDPDLEIRSITKTALYNVNAIIYLVSTGPMVTGDFSLDKQIIDDLSELAGKMDRLFLVFNKIDVLNEDLLIELKKYVTETLNEFDVLNYLPSEPLFISTKNAFKNRVDNISNSDSVTELENQLWSYLLGQNKTGLHKIIGTFSDSLEIIERLKKIINTRLIDSEKRNLIEKEIQIVSSEINQLRQFVSSRRLNIYNSLDEFLNNSLNSILDYMEKDLKTVAGNQKLPESNLITTWLENNAFQTLSSIYAMLHQNTYELQSEINEWISEKLKQVEIAIESPGTSVTFQLPEINKYTNQITGNYHDRKAGYLGLLESFVGGLEEFLQHLVQSIQNLFLSETTVREKQIQDIVSKSRRSYNKISKDCLLNVNEYLTSVCRFMEEKSIDRAKVYLHELSNQLSKLDSPVSSREKLNFEKFLQEVVEIENGIKSNFLHLKEYTDGIEWIK